MEAAAALLIAASPATLSATAVGIGLLDGGHLTLWYEGNITAELRQRYHNIAVGSPVPIAEVADTGQPMVITDNVALDPRFDPVVSDVAGLVHAAIVHPLRDGSGRMIGAMALMWRDARSFSDDEERHVARLAAATGAAVSRILGAQREHRIATGFQEQLLDLDRRSTSVVVGAAYRPAGEAMRVGGDWFLATPLARSGRFAASVGDVVGHGLPAAIVMGRLRAAIAATSLTHDEPAAVLAAVQRYAATVPGARCSTLAYAVIDAERETVDYVCAGHPYPVLVTPDGAARLLTDGREPPLAAFAMSAGSPAGQAHLPTGSLLILYTDGLIERAGESLDRGLERLCEAARELALASTDEVCTQLQVRLAPPGGYSDDVAILAIRPAGVTPTS